MTRRLVVVLLLALLMPTCMLQVADTRAKPPLPGGRQVHVLPQSLVPTVTVEVGE